MQQNNTPFEDFKAMAAEAVSSAGKAAKYYSFVSKQKMLILREQERIRRLYTRLGKICYKDYITDEEPDEAEYLPLYEQVTSSFRYINEMREALAQAKREYQSSQGLTVRPEKDAAVPEAQTPVAESEGAVPVTE